MAQPGPCESCTLPARSTPPTNAAAPTAVFVSPGSMHMQGAMLGVDGPSASQV